MSGFKSKTVVNVFCETQLDFIPELAFEWKLLAYWYLFATVGLELR